jgi:release factor glutamine methyltransferase
MCKNKFRVQDALKCFNDELNESFTVREKRQIGKLFVMNALNYSAADLLLAKKESISEFIMTSLNSSILRMNQGEPMQYVLGSVYFYDLHIEVDSNVLIPRPETEELVDWIVKMYKNRTELRVLDIGTGSGCIPLGIQSTFSSATVLGVDCMEKAIAVARKNAEQLSLPVSFLTADALNEETMPKDQFDVIVSNPPYIPHREKKEMQPHVVDHEPSEALFVSNDDPLVFYKEIANYAKTHLSTSGGLFFEVHENLAKDVKNYLILSGFNQVEIRFDLQGKERMIHAQLEI